MNLQLFTNKQKERKAAKLLVTPAIPRTDMGEKHWNNEEHYRRAIAILLIDRLI